RDIGGFDRFAAAGGRTIPRYPGSILKPRHHLHRSEAAIPALWLFRRVFAKYQERAIGLGQWEVWPSTLGAATLPKAGKCPRLIGGRNDTSLPRLLALALSPPS
ncbi:MAG TPA: hypothetical protein VLL28_16705, partial [Hyphomicrobiaceae bacterium]|nr:hypothetical protein [Hyphomicrobiaceae bacterium]